MAALTVPRAASVATEELDRRSEDVWPVVIAAFRAPSAASVLEDELEMELELALIAANAASRLLEEVER